MQALITRFTEEDPCWTAELLEQAGEDVSHLPALVARNVLSLNNEIYSLTDAGVREFETAARELFIEEEPGRASGAPEKDVFRTKLRLLLDGAHVQRWGIKEFIPRASLPYLPDIKEAPLFSLKDGLRWRYPESAAYQAMERDFPPVTIDARRTDYVPKEQIDAWAQNNNASFGSMDIDLLYLCRYDFMQYKEFPGHQNDPLRLINTDRFLFTAPGDTAEANLEKIGQFHLWLNYLRRMQIPGYVDRDTQEQDSVSWLIFTTEKDSDAQATADALSVFGEALVENANPCEIWTISLEALENLDAKRELVWELLPEIAHPVQRTLL